jgi:hypothetical protein
MRHVRATEREREFMERALVLVAALLVTAALLSKFALGTQVKLSCHELAGDFRLRYLKSETPSSRSRSRPKRPRNSWEAGPWPQGEPASFSLMVRLRRVRGAA